MCVCVRERERGREGVCGGGWCGCVARWTRASKHTTNARTPRRCLPPPPATKCNKTHSHAHTNPHAPVWVAGRGHVQGKRPCSQVDAAAAALLGVPRQHGTHLPIIVPARGWVGELVKWAHRVGGHGWVGGWVGAEHAPLRPAPSLLPSPLTPGGSAGRGAPCMCRASLAGSQAARACGWVVGRGRWVGGLLTAHRPTHTHAHNHPRPQTPMHTRATRLRLALHLCLGHTCTQPHARKPHAPAARPPPLPGAHMHTTPCAQTPCTCGSPSTSAWGTHAHNPMRANPMHLRLALQLCLGHRPREQLVDDARHLQVGA